MKRAYKTEKSYLQDTLEILDAIIDDSPEDRQVLYAINAISPLCKCVNKDITQIVEEDFLTYIDFERKRNRKYPAIRLKSKKIILTIIMMRERGASFQITSEQIMMSLKNEFLKESDIPYKVSKFFSQEFTNQLTEFEKEKTSWRPQKYIINTICDICEYCKKDFFDLEETDTVKYIKYLEKKQLKNITKRTYIDSLMQAEKYFIPNRKKTIFSPALLFHQFNDLQINRLNEIKVDKVFGELTVIRKTEGDPLKWECRCSCGETIEATTNELRYGKKTNCGNQKKHPKSHVQDLTGKTIGCFKVIKKSETNVHNRTAYICQCKYCGKLKCIDVTLLKSKKLKSCGCRQYIRK